MKKLPVHTSHSSQPSSTTRKPASPGSALQNTSLLHWQRTIGNQAVQRHLTSLPGVNLQRDVSKPELTISTPGKPSLLQREWGTEKLDSRIEPQKTESASASCTVAKREVTKQEKKKGTNDPFGSTASKLYIDYSVDEDDKVVTLGCLRPEFTITIFSPYITSDQFAEKFTPLMEKLWNKYDGDIQAFSKDTDVANFNYYDQTMRHEEMHVSARMLSIYDLLPQYKWFLKDTNGLKRGEAHFLDMTDRYWATPWNEQAEKVAPHENIHYLDARLMVEEYRQRTGTDKPKPATLFDQAMDFAKGFFYGSE